MTIRGKLNLVMLSLLGMLLVTTGVVVKAVRTTSQRALAQTTAKELSVFTDNVRAEIFYQTAIEHGFTALRANDWWPEGVLEDIRVRVSLSTNDAERHGWSQVQTTVAALAKINPTDSAMVDHVRQADHQLRKLRRHYDGVSANATAETATAFWTAQTVVVICAGVSILLVTVATLFIRDWFVKPVRELTEATDIIGSGALDHRVAVRSNDELGQLANRINDMSSRLEDHQNQLIMAREMAAIGELCTNVAHGLRNPLAGMRAAAQLATRRAEQPDQLRDTLEDIVSEVDRMDDRISQLFEFAKSAHVDRSATTFNAIIQHAESCANGILRARDIQLEIIDRTGDVQCWVDQQQLSAAIGELITNAAHHSPDGTPVKVVGTIDQDNVHPPQWQVTVEDKGSGISDATRTHIFDLFYTTRPTGTGMGLPLVRRIVQQHGGTLAIESLPEQGTIATISLDTEM